LGINGDSLPPAPPINVEDILGIEDSKTVAWVSSQKAAFSSG
jgi:hypothetical protein